MYTKLNLIFLLQLIYFHKCISHRFGHQVGSTSMDSTHYDRRNFNDQCLSNSETKELQRERFWLAIRSSSSSMNNNTQKNLIPFRRQLITNNGGEDRLIIRTSPNTITLNNTIELGIDQALIDIIVDKQISGNLSVYVQVIECLDCPYEIIAQDLSSNQVLNLTLNTKYIYRIRIELTNTSSCLETLSLYEHGQYTLTVQISTTNSSIDTGLKCLLTSYRLANNIYTPLIVGGVILIGLFIFCIFAQRMKLREYLINLKNRCCNHVPPQESTHSYDLQACPPMTTICQSGIDIINTAECTQNISKIPPIHKISQVIVPRSKRLLSLDAFRGFALIAMIFVNYGGGGYAQFEHSPWHGITFADVVFPLFVWILGASLVFSLKNALDKGVSKRTLLMKVAMRTLKLFIIGFILNTRFKVDLNNVRILGVLQRFAIVYGLIGTIEVLCTRTKQYSLTANLNNNNNNGKHQSTITTTTVKTGRTKRVTTVFRDISNFPLQWLTIIGLTTIWVLVVYLVPYENCPAGYLGPGGLHENGKYENCTGGITNYIDRVIFTDKHLYQYPTCQLVYGCKPPFDPENLLGVIPTTFLAYLGVQAGRILVMYQSDLDRLIRLFAWSIFTTAIGVGLTSGTFDGGLMPLNKNLWTLSFSFFTAGLAFAGFSIMYILIDKFKWWNSTPFQYPGTNSILIYIAHIVFATYFPVQWVVANTHAAHLAMALWGCIFWIMIAYIFFKKRVFLVL